MRRFLVCSGVHGRPRSLVRLRRVVQARRPDGVLFAGGILNGRRDYTPRSDTAWGLTREDALYVERFFRTLGELRVFAAVVPGPGDTPLEEFLGIGMRAEVDFPGIHVVHATLVVHGDVAVCGLGGRVCDGPACEMDLCSRTLAEYHLRALRAARQPRTVLLLGMPPAGPLGGAGGSRIMADLIDSYHPGLCVVAGPSALRGTARVASTLVVNPGQLAEGWAAWLDWSAPAGEQVELLDLRDLSTAAMPADLGVCD